MEHLSVSRENFLVDFPKMLCQYRGVTTRIKVSPNHQVPQLRKLVLRGPLAKIARDAKVSTKTLVMLRDAGDWDTALGEAREKANAGKSRHLEGLAASVTRLAVHFGLKPTEALRELGFPVEEVDVASAITRTTSYSKRQQLVDDPVLARIRGRAAEEERLEGIVKVAVLDWPPFYDDKEREQSFANRYVRMLLAAIDPSWEIRPEVLKAIRPAIDGVVEDPSRYDLVFGLYALPFRRSLGLDFLPIPGLRVPLGAVVRSGSDLDWPKIISAKDHADLRPVVLQEEAGYHFIAGALGFSDFLVLRERDASKIAIDLLNEMATKELKTVFFVADRFTCNSVAQQANSWRRQRPTGLKVRSVPLLEVRPTSKHPDTVPSYAAAIGFRAKADFFRGLLTDSACVELFDNAALRTAELYFDLLRKPESTELVIDIASFDGLGKKHRNHFFSAYTRLFEEKIDSLRLTADVLKGHPAKFLYDAAQEMLREGKIRKTEEKGSRT